MGKSRECQRIHPNHTCEKYVLHQNLGSQATKGKIFNFFNIGVNNHVFKRSTFILFMLPTCVCVCTCEVCLETREELL